MMKSKICLKCGKTKPQSEFRKLPRSKDGLDTWCRFCRRISEKKYRETHKPKIRKKNKTYRETFVGCLKHKYFNMQHRCYNPKHDSYYLYGGRGIKCLFASFEDFFGYMKNDLEIKTIEQIKGLMIDRINVNGHYEPGNIRLVTQAENNHNRRKNLNPTSSKFKGVCWSKTAKKWQASICFRNKAIYLGLYKNEVDAANVYDRKAEELFGEYSCTNADLNLY